MKFIVVGCGRVGAELAHRVSQRGHQVVVIDQSEASFQNLPTEATPVCTKALNARAGELLKLKGTKP